MRTVANCQLSGIAANSWALCAAIRTLACGLQDRNVKLGSWTRCPGPGGVKMQILSNLLRGFLGATLLAVLVAAAILGSRPAAAVEQTGDLTGTVRDEKAEGLPGATITLKGDNLLGERSTVTDTKGEFSFRSLPPGKYTVKIAFVGYQAIEQDGVTVNIGRTTTLPINLTKGELSESVTVIGKTPLVDTVRTTTQHR